MHIHQQQALVPIVPNILSQLDADLPKGAEQVPFLLPAPDQPCSSPEETDHEQPAVILFGLDHKNKAHASYFDVTNAYEARQAASGMNMMSLDIINDHLRSLVKDLPKGRLFASGKAFVPFVSKGIYNQLAAYAQKSDNPKNNEKDKKKKEPVEPVQCGDEPSLKWYNTYKISKYASDWINLKKGDVVLAVGDPDDGWWEAEIIRDEENGCYELAWVGCPELDTFSQHYTALAVFHPNYKPQEDNNETLQA